MRVALKAVIIFGCLLLFVTNSFPQYGKKTGIVILPFTTSCDNQNLNWISSGFPDLLEVKINQRYKNRIHVVDRKRLNSHIREQQLTQGGFTMSDESVSTGKYFSANYSIYGNIMCLSSTEVCVISKIVNVETTEMVSDECYGKVNDLYKTLPDTISRRIYERLIELKNRESTDLELISAQADYSQKPVSNEQEIQMFSMKSMDAVARFYKAVDFMQRNEWQLAEQELLRAIELDPDFAQAYVNLGSVYMNQGKYSLSKTSLSKALQIFPNSEYAYHSLGLLYSNLNDFRNAIINYDLALKISPDDCEILNDLGMLYFKLQKFDLAKHYFSRILAIDSTFVAADLYLGSIAARFDADFPKAEFHWQRVTNSNETYFALYKRMALENLGKLYLEKTNNLDRAIECYEQEKDLYSQQMSKEEYLSVNYLLARAYLSNHASQQAQILFKENVDEDPTNPEYRYFYGISLCQTNQKDLAIVQFETICKIDSTGYFCREAQNKYLKSLRGY